VSGSLTCRGLAGLRHVRVGQTFLRRFGGCSVGHVAEMEDSRSTPRRDSAELLGELARELSALVRRDVDVAAVERLSVLRRGLLDLAAIAAVVLAALFALVALTFAFAVAIAAAIPTWSAALVVAAAWALIAAALTLTVLRRRAQPPEHGELIGLLQLISRKHGLEHLRAWREQARDEADQQVRNTAAALVDTLLDEAAEHQVKALPTVATERLAEAADAAAPNLLSDALALFTAPARAGLSILGRIVEPVAAPSETARRNLASRDNRVFPDSRDSRDA
jgi:hypothetical protein